MVEVVSESLINLLRNQKARVSKNALENDNKIHKIIIQIKTF